MSTNIRLSDLNQISEQQGFVLCSVTPVKTPLTFIHYASWLERNYHGSMNYLQVHASAKKDPHQHFPQYKTVISLAHNYLPHPFPENPLEACQVALYAQGQDYHHWLKEKLDHVASKLKRLAPGNQFLTFTDSAPILERDWAYRSGLGWFGKNTCIIHPKKGSLFLLGEILTDLSIDSEPQLMHDFCGTCTRCIDACPTQALEGPRLLDANKCISYLTIESKNTPPVELREKMGSWLFGCDICQTVCPWNQKAFGPLLPKPPQEDQVKNREKLIAELRWILSSSGKKLQKIFRKSPLLRAGPKGLKRNALIVAGNLKLAELTPQIQELKNHPYFSELCEWALQCLDDPQQREKLLS